MNPGRVRRDINELIQHLLFKGLVNDYQEAFEQKSNITTISFGNAKHISSALKNLDYQDIYSTFATHRVFNARMVDGAFIQMTYQFKANRLLNHRLAFLPPPHSFLDESDLAMAVSERELADFINGNRVGQPLRFDFNSNDDIHIDVIHPKSHLTLGVYVNCRIPVTAALSPYWFLYFILQSFYSTHSSDYLSTLPRLTGYFPVSLAPAEKKVPHLVVPR